MLAGRTRSRMASAFEAGSSPKAGEQEAPGVSRDRLLEWMTHLGSGSWDAFREAVHVLDDGEIADDAHKLYRAVRIAFSDLGYADFFVDGSRRWRVRRPAILATACGDGEHVVSGGRPSRLVDEVLGLAPKLGATATVEVDAPGLSRVRLRGERGAMEHLAARRGGLVAAWIEVFASISIATASFATC